MVGEGGLEGKLLRMVFEVRMFMVGYCIDKGLILGIYNSEELLGDLGLCVLRRRFAGVLIVLGEFRIWYRCCGRMGRQCAMWVC